ncbi:hypothetical protein AAV94_00760 [Lampropedia cohaerens]|uniref:General secretion pathway protein H n=1 Tax=Lampropedia cohaerens TaxID=1610491 RepID=A0A0U1Q3I1_9BURK|nr:prepilin-type N-terminal cleavage/methylation domain-containing protein [Lampropedia cohaerens]KKW69294.1 hypothetical protein AAV94_00760 [Lampropedia cohaerens]
MYRHAANRFAAQRGRGFTLLEVLMVMAIIAIGVGLVALSWPDTRLRALEREGDRLATLLETARVHARANGQPLRWRLDAQGFRFEGQPPHLIATLPTHWELADVQASAVAPLILGPEPILPAQRVDLFLPDRPNVRVVVSSDGLRPFRAALAP